jgi:hypothetical protein
MVAIHILQRKRRSEDLPFGAAMGRPIDFCRRLALCAPMRRVFYVAFCLAGMTGVWWLCKTMVVSTSSGFSSGLVVGFFLATFLIWLAEKVDHSH